MQCHNQFWAAICVQTQIEQPEEGNRLPSSPSTFDRPAQQTPRNITLQDDGDHDHRYDHDQNEYGHIPPLGATRRVLSGNVERQGLSLGARQEQSQQVLIPGKNQDKQERSDQPWDGQWQNNGPERAIAGSTINGSTFFQLQGDGSQIIAHEPDDDGQITGDISDYESNVCIK